MVDTKVQVRRAYEDPAQGDGTRVLVDRIWPRGLTKARAALDEWRKKDRAVNGAAQVVWPRPGALRGIRPPLPGGTERA